MNRLIKLIETKTYSRKENAYKLKKPQKEKENQNTSTQQLVSKNQITIKQESRPQIRKISKGYRYCKAAHRRGNPNGQ